ncbi:MAG: hypothetical protein ABL952_10640 [Pyrinomonadaceae bacterium]
MSNDVAQLKGCLFIVGAVLVVISSVVIGILNFGVLYLFGVPILILIVGVLFIWFSNAALKFKALVTLLPIPLILLSFFITFQIRKAEPETFLIPKDFRGMLVVFYNEPCGRPPIYRDGRRVYEIPQDGVLITQSEENRGGLNQKFYLVDSEKNEIEIPFFRRQNFETEKKEWPIFHQGSAEDFTKETVGVFWGYGSETYFVSQDSFSFIISNFHLFEKDEKDKWLARKQFTEKARIALRDCRQTQ